MIPNILTTTVSTEVVSNDLFPVQFADVSVYQGQMNWDIYFSYFDFVILRAGFGSGSTLDNLDFLYGKNRFEVTKRNKNFGIYWVLKPDKDWRKTADSFSLIYKDSGSKFLPVVDVELTGGLDKISLESWVYKCISRIEDNVEKEVMIYTAAWFWNQYLPLTSWAKFKKLWVANYTTASKPIMPLDWTPKNNPNGYPYTLWQYSADGNKLGRKYGATEEDIDLNRYRLGFAEWEKEFGFKLQPVVEPIPEPEPDEIEPIRLVTTTANLNVRAKPNALSTDIGTLMKDTQVPIVEDNNGWGRLDGYISLKYTK